MQPTHLLSKEQALSKLNGHNISRVDGPVPEEIVKCQSAEFSQNEEAAF